MRRIATRTTFSSRPVDCKFSSVFQANCHFPFVNQVQKDQLDSRSSLIHSVLECFPGMLQCPRSEPTPRLIRWEVMSSSHLAKGKIVEFAPNRPQTESSEPNEQFIAMLVYEPRNSKKYNGFALDLLCITMTSNLRDDHILDKITMYTYAFRSPQ